MMTDVDSVTLQSNPGVCTTLALALAQAMHNDASARARYLAIYGEEWMPCDALDFLAIESKSHAPSTYAATVR